MLYRHVGLVVEQNNSPGTTAHYRTRVNPAMPPTRKNGVKFEQQVKFPPILVQVKEKIGILVKQPTGQHFSRQIFGRCCFQIKCKDSVAFSLWLESTNCEEKAFKRNNGSWKIKKQFPIQYIPLPYDKRLHNTFTHRFPSNTSLSGRPRVSRTSPRWRPLLVKYPSLSDLTKKALSGLHYSAIFFR